MTNPYAYTEETPESVQAWEHEAESGQEPVMPFDLALSGGIIHGRAMLSVYQDRCELSGGSLKDTMVISRGEAAKRIKVKANKLIFRNESGRPLSFRYKRDKLRELKHARLETWCKQRWGGDVRGAYSTVLSLLKRNVCAPVMGLLLFFAVLQIGVIVIQIFDYLDGGYKEYDPVFTAVLLTIHASPALISLFFATLLWLRQIWALVLGAVFSLFPWLVVILLLFAPEIKIRVIISLLLFVCLLATYSFANAVIRYYSQRKQLVEPSG